MAASPIVSTEAGAYAGRPSGGVLRFLGIPYARPPVGARRWQPPQPPEAFTGVRAAHRHGASCPQPPGGDAPFRAAARLAEVDERHVSIDLGPTDEDCLYLNVWTPAADSARRPVLVWIHGGASVWGTGSAAVFDGTVLAREQDAVVVTIHYRLGVFGFLAHPRLVNGDHGGGNLGLLDMVAALRWVRGSIAGFGGDPERVTIVGESAGGRAVLELMTVTPACGLFHSAIALSPWDLPNHARRLDQPWFGLPSAQTLGERLAEQIGDPSDAMERLRSATTDELIAASATLGDPTTTWGTVVDGVVLRDHVLASFDRSAQAPIPLLIGWTEDESAVFFAQRLPVRDPAGYRRFVERAFGDQASAVLAAYPPGDDATTLAEAFLALYDDRTFALPARLAARSHAGRGHPTFVYRFTHAHPPFDVPCRGGAGLRIGAFHTSELPLLFGTGEPLDPHDEPLGSALRHYVGAFARDGRPDAAGLPGWPSFEVAEERYLELGDQVRPRCHPAEERLAVLERALAERLGLDER